MSRLNRREFLLQSGGALVAGSTATSALCSIAPARAADAAVRADMVRFRPEIESVVQWIEQTPRDRVFDRASDVLAKGLPYRELLAGLFLAGIRNIKPRPVGFKFHAVMVINSAHQLSLDAPQADRLYPLFWALDNFKSSQARDVSEGDWWLGPAREPDVPSPAESRRLFVQAMEDWDIEAADAAVTGLCRAAGAGELKDALWEYGARNHRDIGHNIIFTAQSFRTLDTIGFQHAEPVLRSLVYGILDGRKGEASAAPFEPNRERVAKIRADWAAGKPDDAAAKAMLEILRSATPDEAGAAVVETLNRGVAADSIWDGIVLAASELLMQNPSVVLLHASTAVNSLHYAYRAAGRDRTRLMMLLMAASWIPLYRRNRRSRPEDSSVPPIDRLSPVEPGEEVPPERIFEQLGENRLEAARRTLAYAERGGSADAFMDVGRRLIFNKGTDSHDYKYSAAVFEEFIHAGPAFRPRMMAASVYYLKPASARDSSLLLRTREALARIRG